MQSVSPNISAVIIRLNRMNLSTPNTSLFCNVCQVHVSSESVMQVHVKGKKHCQLEQRQREQTSVAAQSIYVRGFPTGSTADQLTEFFQQFGQVNKVILDREYGHYAIIEFSEVSAAKSVLSKSSIFMNKSPLTIRPRQMKGTQPKRKPKRSPQRPLQQLTSAATSSALPSNVIDFDQIKEKLKECSSMKEEMDLLVSGTSLSSDDFIIRQKILRELEEILQRNFCPDCQVHLFGSSVNGLGTKGCDLDLFLDLRLEEASSQISTSSKMDCDLGHHSIQVSRDRQDSAVPDNNSSTTCDDSIAHENDADTETGSSSRKENEAHLLQSSKSVQESIKKISNLLRARSDIYAQVVRVTSARCPVVKFVHLSTSLKCDLSINNRLALRNTSLIQFLSSVDSRIRPLIFSIRQWAKVRGVAGQLNAGSKLTNYALTMIVLFYLQNRLPPILPSVDRLSHLAENPCVIDGWDCTFTTDLRKLRPDVNTDQSEAVEEGDGEKRIEEREPVEELLSGFFEFYSKFDFSLKVICLRPGEAIDLNSFSEQMTSDPHIKDFKISPIMVQDPFVLNHNIASNVNEKSLLFLQAELKAAATKCRTQQASATAAHPRPSLLPLFSSEPTASLIDSVPRLGELQTAASHARGTSGETHSFFVKVEASKLMMEALRQQKSFTQIQDGWCQNSVMIVRHTLKIFNVQCCLLKQPQEQAEHASTGGGTANQHEDSGTANQHEDIDADNLQTDSSKVDEKTIQSEDTKVVLANGSSGHETQENDSCPHDRKEICSVETNRCRKRYSLKDDNGKELKRPKSCSDNASKGSGSKLKDSPERSSKSNSTQQHSSDHSCMENNSAESAPLTEEQTCRTEKHLEKKKQTISPIFSAECSTHSRLWIGRKKVRKQLSNLNMGDYEKEVQVSQILSSQLKPTEQQDTQNVEALLKFRIFISAEKSPSTVLMVSMEIDIGQGSKEFSCFFFSFRSVVEKLVEKYGMEDIGDWKMEG